MKRCRRGWISLGTQIETMRLFDPGSQRTVKTLETLLVTPARELLPVKARVSVTPYQMGRILPAAGLSGAGLFAGLSAS